MCSKSLGWTVPVVSSDRRRVEGTEEGEGEALGQRSAAGPITTLSTGTPIDSAMACCIAGDASELNCTS